MRTRWSVEQKNIICRQSCGRLDDGTVRCRAGALHTSIGAGSVIKGASEIVYGHFGQWKAAAKAPLDEDRDRLSDAIAEDHRCDDAISLLASAARQRARLLGGRSEREFQ